VCRGATHRIFLVPGGSGEKMLRSRCWCGGSIFRGALSLHRFRMGGTAPALWRWPRRCALRPVGGACCARSGRVAAPAAPRTPRRSPCASPPGRGEVCGEGPPRWNAPPLWRVPSTGPARSGAADIGGASVVRRAVAARRGPRVGRRTGGMLTREGNRRPGHNGRRG
jgi:hypothetical protein